MSKLQQPATQQHVGLCNESGGGSSGGSRLAVAALKITVLPLVTPQRIPIDAVRTQKAGRAVWSFGAVERASPQLPIAPLQDLAPVSRDHVFQAVWRRPGTPLG